MASATAFRINFNRDSSNFHRVDIIADNAATEFDEIRPVAPRQQHARYEEEQRRNFSPSSRSPRSSLTRIWCRMVWWRRKLLWLPANRNPWPRNSYENDHGRRSRSGHFFARSVGVARCSSCKKGTTAVALRGSRRIFVGFPGDDKFPLEARPRCPWPGRKFPMNHKIRGARQQ